MWGTRPRAAAEPQWVAGEPLPKPQEPPQLLPAPAFRLCLAFVFLLMVIITIILPAVKLKICHHGKYPPEQCPSRWIGFRNKCYFISEEEKTWTSSQTFCAENESMLATFETQEEMHSLAKSLKIDNCWIGLHKKGETFYWENGAALKKALFQIQNHSECVYLGGFTISTLACSLPRCSICVKLHIDS